MKIAIFTDTYYPQLNGVTVSVANYANELEKKGHTVFIFAPKIRGYKDKDPKVYRLPSVKILSAEPDVHAPIGISTKGLSQLLRMDFDIVHGHGNGLFSMMGYEVARTAGIPYIMTFHTVHTEYTHYFLKGRVVKPKMIATALRIWGNRCDGLITPSKKMQQKLMEFGITKPILVLPNFIILDKFTDQPKGYLHKQLGLSQSTPIILSVGRLGIEKNFSFVINTFNTLVKSYNFEKGVKPHLVIVGKGPEKKALQKLIKNLGLSDMVHFTGNITTELMPQIYADSYMFLFASTTETQGVCVLEAAASGLPMVLVDDLAFFHMVEDKKTGFLVPLEEKAFAEKIAYLLENPEEASKFGQRGRILIEKYFQPDRLSMQLENYYKKIYLNFHPGRQMFKRVHRVARTSFRTIRRTQQIIGKVLLR